MKFILYYLNLHFLIQTNFYTYHSVKIFNCTHMKTVKRLTIIQKSSVKSLTKEYMSRWEHHIVLLQELDQNAPNIRQKIDYYSRALCLSCQILSYNTCPEPNHNLHVISLSLTRTHTHTHQHSHTCIHNIAKC